MVCSHYDEGDYLNSTSVKISENLIFLTPDTYTHVSVLGGKKY